ncbi:MYND-type domain-containing protein [Mycena chlorophos]|uniref:MYND-type domain-containing protein n=1 Tax=Mycena chlorophos TaxID=658473 RepID=A0A8H6VZI0_MYCCL|nr:MYND-type domain-containing protein [Mycena chlorophos]
MHPLLKLSNLVKLPPKYKKLAQAAISSYGQSDDALHDLVHAVPSLSAHAMPHVLSVCYRLLEGDSSVLRTLADEENATALGVRLCSLADTFGIVTTVLGAVDIPDEPALEIWKRIWYWAVPLETYTIQFQLHESATIHAYTFILSAALIVAKTGFDLRARRDGVVSTPKLWCLITRAWLHLAYSSKSAHDKDVTLALKKVVFALRHLTFDILEPESNCLTEIKEVIGGDSQLAALIIQHFVRVLTVRRDMHDLLSLVDGVLVFLGDLSCHFESLCKQLIEHGICTQLVRCCRALLTSATPLESSSAAAEAVIGACDILGLLLEKYCMAAGRSIDEALSAGVLELLYISSLPDDAREFLTDFLDVFLPASTVYISVLIRLLAKIHTVDPSKFASHMYDAPWQALLELVRQRSSVLSEPGREGGVVDTLRACHNLNCNAINTKKTFKVCSRCLVAHYCSELCQRADYRGGDHRTQCLDLQEQRDYEKSLFTPRDLRFIPRLLNHEYEQNAASIGTQIVKLWRRNPAAIPCVKFDLSTGPCRIEVLADDDPRLRHLFDCEDIILRLLEASAQSRGRVWVHLLELRAGPGVGGRAATELFPRPMRMAGSTWWDGLRRIADAYSMSELEGVERGWEVEEDVQKLVGDCAEIISSH